MIEPLTVRPWSYFGPLHYFPEMKDSPLLLCASPFNATLPLAPLKQQNIISNELYRLIFSNTEEHHVQAIYRTMHRIWSLMNLGLSTSHRYPGWLNREFSKGRNMQNWQEGQEAPGALGLVPSYCKLLFVHSHLELNKLWLRLSQALTPRGHLFQKFFLLIPSLCVFVANLTQLSLCCHLLFTWTIPFLVFAAFYSKEKNNIPLFL